ncbi:Crp/Fnr family transcriptional regulator [Chitinophaga pinensis]|uniref:Transcriptional regulator, Crp/Fnr family n=1 Tax=Chitinophaga pinensis (strain ATCC 43595 / DSM 2588 / LMG 13176 / NBRC 15968 / NCIMB 11800 / UQM 2034) TaxID=485918 RepID=A0A979GAB9_CHIPD|nr:Crp/Fnr family transcriptional regulator [Chitinophaga pinensis]ACU63593.1 putative transcriptional regulator, Crp/Fnr family [Chitinophaga pinensis DSM 2588]
MDSQLFNYLQPGNTFSATEQAEILHTFDRKTFKEGEVLFHSGNVCRQLFFICKGVLRILVQGDNGNDVTYFFVNENHFCTILNSFMTQTLAHESIVAACELEVMMIDRAALLDLYKTYPLLKPLIDARIQQALLEKINTRNAYLGLDSTARYQLFLEKQPDIARRVQLSDVASYLGITPQSLSRIRRNKVL